MNFQRINGYESPNEVNSILQSLNAHGMGKIKVFGKEIAFKSEFSRTTYCNRMKELETEGQDVEEFGTSSQMVKFARKSGEFVFLCACNETSANSFTHAYSSRTIPRLEDVARRNAAHTLDWHNTVIFYVDGTVFFFDPRMDIKSAEYSSRSISFKFKERLMDFLHNKERLKVQKIFVGCSNVRGNCRKLCFKFLLDIVNARIVGKQCENYIFYEFSKGSREPSGNRLLATLSAIPWTKL